MSGIICTCNIAAKNLGLPGCTDQVGIPKRLIFVPTYQENGTLNYINTTTFAFTQAAWDALQYNTDTNARYYPLAKDIEAVEMPKGDSVYHEFPSGYKAFVRDGVRSFKGSLPGAAIPIIGKLKSKGCSKYSVFIVDNNGALVGIEKTLGMLYPFQLSDNSLNSIFQFATDSTVGMVNIMLEFAQNNADEQIALIPASDLGTGVDLFTTFNGKMDTTIEQVGVGTTTVIVVKIYQSYGTAKTKIPISGLVLADFVLYNVTDSIAVVPSGVVETPDGTYTFTMAAQTATDIERLSLAVTANAKPFEDSTWAAVQLKHQA